jgi:putative hydrolase of the HAD superfamily
MREKSEAMSDAKPEVLLFDFGGTLDADGVAWKDRFFRLVADAGVSVDRASFDKAFYDADDALVGKLPRELSLAQTVQRLSLDLARGLGGDSALARRIGTRFLDEALAKLAANARVLEKLAERYRIGIVSNFYGNLEATCAGTSIGRYVDAAIDSEAVGATKPDPRIFQAALDALATSSDRAIFVGDSLPRDMEGARRMGMRHIWLHPGATSACCPADPVIANVSELLRVLP